MDLGFEEEPGPFVPTIQPQEHPKLGWLINMHPTSWTDPETSIQKAALDLYFLQEEGHHTEVENFLRRKYEQYITKLEPVEKEDLDLKNHLSGITKTYVKVSFLTIKSLTHVRDELMPIVRKNKERRDAMEAYEDPHINISFASTDRRSQNASEHITDIREYDVIYYTRVSIDLGIRVGFWYLVTAELGGDLKLEYQATKVDRPEPRILAFDIETTKLPLKFPDATIDSIIMISYMIDKQGFLIVNREIVSEDIENFEYTPKPDFEGSFIVHNAPDERGVLEYFFGHIKNTKPNIFVTFNGDYFDWPFVEARAEHHKISMYKEIGIKARGKDKSGTKYSGCFASHMDAFAWVKRDSYLPQGGQGLKAVTKAKLGYEPLELDPEKMTIFASEQPQTLASYSVSDAVATWYLYMTYVHPFIFSLCTVVPMNPDDVLRKGSGTLCEALLMAEACKANVIFPNKHGETSGKTYRGHLLESETYVGGHVESLESGIFRQDIALHYNIDTGVVDSLKIEIDGTLQQAAHEGGLDFAEIENYDEIRSAILAKLDDLSAAPDRTECPNIYHLDVAAMYPNIILTNRLQPSAIVDAEICAACDFNKPENQCQRAMKWDWRGDYLPLSMSEYRSIKDQLEQERFTVNGKPLPFRELPAVDQAARLKNRVKDYCRKVYKKVHVEKEVERTDTVCMRENAFYVDTVRAFRDRRYKYKDELKKWKIRYDSLAKDKAATAAQLQESAAMVIVYESLQLAHKCILNSFYGYVMRKGARWYSMEMAGIVTRTGSDIIKYAHQTIAGVGKLLELDTDGIWCALPKTFPTNFKFRTRTREFTFSYPCVMLNTKLKDRFTNKQYQTLVDKATHKYEKSSECSILFEVDGPYRAMILPASKDKDVKLKKRYAVFNHNGSLAELKGFEVKRRGELKLIKIFQTQVFEYFLKGKTLAECYEAVGAIANSWLSVLRTKGEGMEDDELIELITESSNMSKKLEEYDKTKSCAITTANRLAAFLGAQMVKEKGLSCAYVISKTPLDTMVTERAIPVAIFSAAPNVRREFLQKWIRGKSSDSYEIRDIVDWDYYKSRLSSGIQKIITIPAALQRVKNPCPEVPHPDWLAKQLQEKATMVKLDKVFETKQGVMDIEDAFRPIRHATSTENGKSERKQSPPKSIPEKKAPKTQPKRKYEEMVKAPPLVGPVPDMNKDYSGWLEHQKVAWRRKREAKKLAYKLKKARIMRGLPEEDLLPQMEGGSGLNKFFQTQTRAVLTDFWQIVQIEPTQTPGVFNLWALVGEGLHSMKIEVPRQFYINSMTPDQSGVGKPVSYIIPRGKKRYNLYEYSMSETAYQANAKELATQFTAPSIEGVYERGVPLMLRALIKLGCMCSVSKNKRNYREYFNLDELSAYSGDRKEYLEQDSFRQIFFYHSALEGRGALFAVFRCSQPYEATLVIANTHATQYQDSQLLKPLTEKYRDYSFELKRVKTIEEARTLVQSVVEKYKRGPSVMLVQSTKFQELMRDMRILSELPRVVVPYNLEDDKYGPLNWEVQVTKTLLSRFNDVNGWTDFYLRVSRYTNIPFGNIDKDMRLASDIVFARHLIAEQRLLWASDNSIPDMGGSEEDEALFAEELVNPEVCEPAFYNTCCLEFEVLALAANTILEASNIGNIEGGSNLLSFESIDDDGTIPANPADAPSAVVQVPKTYDLSMSCLKEFKVLKKLISYWTYDISSKDEDTSVCGGLLHSLLYYWLSSPFSLFYDPALHRLVHNLMRKIFMQLLLELRRFGAKVVYANFNKIIIATNKLNLEDAKTYADFIMETFKKKDLFGFIDIRLDETKMWESLMFLDCANYGGIRSMSDNDSVAHWNIVEYLPPVMQDHFNIIITDFIVRMLKRRGDGANHQEDDEEDNERGAGARRKTVIDEITQHLFRVLTDIQRTLNTIENRESAEFPQRPGSHLNLTNPALEFIKFTCHLLSLDKSLEQPVLKLKKSLLQLINVREFAPEAQFQNPSLSFILPDVTCHYCSKSVDLDLLRDDNTSRCSCGQPYNKNLMEAMLVEMAQKRSVAYQLQDLVCAKCGAVKAENLAETCSSCSGSWVCKEPKDEFKKRYAEKQLHKNRNTPSGH